MPRYLTDQDIADFRAELCRVATERFARFGYEGVTMRQLAEALGCSPKTPYRYFKDKADILATVRAQAFGKFADALEAAAASAPPGDPIARMRRVGEAYHQFALKNWHAYRIMFDIDAPIDEQPSRPRSAGRPGGALHHAAGRGAGQARLDLRSIRNCSAGRCGRRSHGLVMLQQAGMLEHAPDYRTLAEFPRRPDVQGRRAVRQRRRGKKR